MSDPKDYIVGWICAISTEYVAARAFLDEEHEGPEFVSTHDHNDYTLGKIGRHNVVIAVLPNGEYGESSAASVARDLMHSFPNVRIGLMVGIGGGAPNPPQRDIRLGDIVVSTPHGNVGGVLQYDFGKMISGHLQITGFLDQPPTILRAAANGLKSQYESDGHQFDDAISNVLDKKPRLRKKFGRPDSNTDKLYRADFNHRSHESSCAEVCGDDPTHLVSRDERTQDEDNIAIHYGLIGSGNCLMKDAKARDRLAAAENILCFEMEAAGLMNHFPCLVIRGICDYSDSHKSKEWQGYAAMAAAAYAKDLLRRIPPNRVEAEKKIGEIVLNISKDTTQIKNSINILSHKISNDEDLKILNWLTSTDYGPQQTDYFKERQEGTGQWFLDSLQFQEWLNGEEEILFCPGIPGAGKTILTSIVVDELTRRFGGESSIGIAYIYCNYNMKDVQKADDLLASVLKQLANSQSTLPKAVKSLYDHHEKRNTRPTLDEISDTLQSVITEKEKYSKVFVIIDALDECQVNDSHGEGFLTKIFKLREAGKTHICATSRPIPRIMDRFQGSPTIHIQATNEDVQRYVGAFFKSEFVSKAMKDCRVEIERKLNEIVQGMFLLAQLYLESLKGKTTQREIKETLNHFQKPVKVSNDEMRNSLLDQTYDAAMARIQEQAGSWKELAEKVLSWIIYAKRRLNVSELQHALAVKKGDSDFHFDGMPYIDEVVSICAGLVTVDKESDIIRLVHHTTQEYFEQTSKKWFPEAETQITETCVTYLSFDTFKAGFCLGSHQLNERFRKFKLYNYAAKNWGIHARKTAKASYPTIIAFLKRDSNVTAAGQARKAVRYGDNYRSKEEVPEEESGLHLAASFGLEDIVKALLGDNNMNLQDGKGRTMLSVAAEYGHKHMVNMLLESDVVDADLADSSLRTPLSWAARYGHENVVELLLNSGKVNANSQDSYGRTPLSWAAANKHKAIVNMLLESGIDPDISDNFGRTPLSRAAGARGNKDIVKVLLESKKVDADSTDGEGRTPLSWAVMKVGNKDTVKLLFDLGKVDPNITDIDGRSPLSLAARVYGNQHITKILLESEKVDADIKDKHGRTPLSWTVENWHNRDNIKVLLESVKVDANMKDVHGQTPLFAAIMRQSEKTVEILLETKKVDADPKDNYGKSPLTYAVAIGHVSIVKSLLKTDRVNVNSKDNTGRTPLSWAAGIKSQGEQEVIVDLLLGSGKVDANLPDEGGWTPLRWAVHYGAHAMVKILLASEEVDANLPDKDGRTPLSEGINRGDVVMVELLYESEKVDVDSKDKNSVAPMWIAAGNGFEDIEK